MDRDARAIERYLEESHPSFKITVQFWTPVDI